MRFNLDGFRNLLSGLGSHFSKAAYTDPGPATPGTGGGYYSRMSYGDLEYLYEQGGLASMIIDKPVRESWSRGWSTTLTLPSEQSDEDQGKDPLKDYAEARGLTQKLREADLWSDLYGGAALIVQVDDGRPSFEPLDEDNVRTIGHFIVADRIHLTPLETETDWRSRHYGKPRRYYYTPPVSGTRGLLDGNVIHADRVVRMQGRPLPERRRVAEHGWWLPKLERIRDALKQFQSVCDGMEGSLHEMNIPVWSIEGLREIVADEKSRTNLTERILFANMIKGLAGALLLDRDMESFEFRNPNFTGMPDLFDRFQRLLSAIAEIPMTILFGEAPGGLSTDDKSGRNSFYDMIDGRRTDFCEPPLLDALRLCRLAKDAPRNLPDGPLSIKWPAMQRPSQAEIVEMHYKQAQTDDIYLQWRVLSPRTVGTSRFGGAEYSFETELQEEDLQPPPDLPQHQDGVAIQMISDIAPSSESVMIALYPPASWKDALAPFADEQELDDLHLTLAYLGERDPMDVNRIAQVLAEALEGHGPQVLRASGPGFFFNDDVLVRLLLIGGVTLGDLRADITGKLREHYLLGEQRHGFIPHMTLAYHGPGSKLPEYWSSVKDVELDPWIADSVFVVQGGEVRFEIPLQG